MIAIINWVIPKDEVNTDKPKAKDEQCGHHYW
jgi:hypothetical protein